MGDDGFSEDAPATPSSSALEEHAGHAAAGQSSQRDLQRARTKIPRKAYKGDDFGSMSETLNKWLLLHAPNSKSCDEWTVDELQKLQVQLFVLRDPELNGVYQEVSDKRLLQEELTETMLEWEELNTLAKESPELMRIPRDGHCPEAVMWYVHHLPEVAKSDLKKRIALPLL